MNHRTAQCLKTLTLLGFQPQGILDIGAHDGEFSKMCRELFPTTPIFMVDALEEKTDILRGVTNDIGNAKFAICALGAHEGTTLFYVPDIENNSSLYTTGSSMYPENAVFNLNARNVPLKQLNKLINETFDNKGVFNFIKLDVQGAELDVIVGLGYRLYDVEVILSEISFVDYNKGAPRYVDVLTTLESLGFKLHDIVTEHRYTDGRLLQIDAVFVRKNSKYELKPPFWGNSNT